MMSDTFGGIQAGLFARLAVVFAHVALILVSPRHRHALTLILCLELMGCY
jgi:hypothetical protein